MKDTSQSRSTVLYEHIVLSSNFVRKGRLWSHQWKSDLSFDLPVSTFGGKKVVKLLTFFWRHVLIRTHKVQMLGFSVPDASPIDLNSVDITVWL